MNQKIIQKILLRVISIGAYVILFAPLFVSGEFIFPFVALKVSVFRVVTEIMVGAYVLLWLQDSSYRPRKNPVLIAMLGFFVIQVISSVLGNDLYMSFWSSYERMWGLLTAVHVVGFLIVISSVFKTKEQWLVLFRVSLFVSALVSLYGLLQVLGVDLPTNSGSRIESTIGNAAFLAAYLLFHLFFAAYLFVEDKLHRWKKFYIAVFVIDFVILFYAATRGAFVGLVIGLLVMLVYALVQKGKPQLRRKFAAGLAIVVIVLAGLFIARDTAFVKSIKPLNRVTHISLTDGSVLSRLVVWELSLKGVKDRPILGYGEESYDKVFNTHYDSRVTEEWFDRAHNIVLDVLIANGAIGLIAYASIFVAAFWLMWRQREDAVLFPFFAGLLIAYVIQNMFVFDTINTIIPFLLTLGFIIYKTTPAAESVDGTSMRTIPVPALLVAVVVVGFGAYVFTIRPLQASAIAINGFQWQQANPARTLELTNRALALGTYGNREIALQLNLAALNVLGNPQLVDSDKKKFIVGVSEILQNSIEQHTDDTRMYMAQAQLYQLANRFDSRYLDFSIPLLTKAQELSPGRLETYYGLAQVALAKQDFDTAINYLNKAIAIAPEDGDPHYVLSLLLLQQGALDEALSELREVERLKYDYKQDQYAKLVQLFAQYDRYDRVVYYYELALEKFPENPQYWASLADAYLQTQAYDKARAAVQRAIELDSETFGEEAVLFLELIDQSEQAAAASLSDE